MKTIKVNLGERSYEVLIGFNIISGLVMRLRELNLGNIAYIVTNDKVKALFGAGLLQTFKKGGFSACFHIVPDSESGKSFSNAVAIINGLSAYAGQGKVFVVALGGGVVGDVAGFAASVYRRGVPFIQIPTTLLAQVDSSIGGKNGVDLKQGKNLAGTFYQPKVVISDLAFLSKLDLRQMRSGLAEVIKYAVIADKRLFDYLAVEKENILIKKDQKALEFIVTRCASIKAALVRSDEKDVLGLRIALNFGHSLGHALEASGGFRKYNHGEAIAWGMLCAVDLSRLFGVLKNPAIAEKIEALLSSYGLPVQVKGIAVEDMLSALQQDKKFLGVVNRLVLLEDLGKTSVRENVDLSLIKKVLNKRIQ